MITESRGNLLKAPVDALVNTVNTQGVMGRGIALQFKKAFPAMFKNYAAAAKRGDLGLGRMHVWPTQALVGPRFIINFPTKGHWRSKSRMSDIDSGLCDLVRVVRDLGITSIAIPPLGCGNGGLPWSEVEPRIHAAFESLSDVEVHLYAPTGTPDATDMPISSAKPPLTPGRAALVGMIEGYTRQALAEPSLIETQKLMYFLQVIGEPLNLRFSANRYGPYADNLRHVLSLVEGHYLTGYGDGDASVLYAAPLSAVPSVAGEVEEFLNQHADTKQRMDRVLALAEGFESAYGMELLATVHWVAARAPRGTSDADIAAKVAEWSPRKATMMTPTHVDAALETLRAHSLVVGG